jgi:hypothetical protein
METDKSVVFLNDLIFHRNLIDCWKCDNYLNVSREQLTECL